MADGTFSAPAFNVARLIALRAAQLDTYLVDCETLTERFCVGLYRRAESPSRTTYVVRFAGATTVGEVMERCPSDVLDAECPDYPSLREVLSAFRPDVVIGDLADMRAQVERSSLDERLARALAQRTRSGTPLPRELAVHRLLRLREAQDAATQSDAAAVAKRMKATDEEREYLVRRERLLRERAAARRSAAPRLTAAQRWQRLALTCWPLAVLDRLVTAECSQALRFDALIVQADAHARFRVEVDFDRDTYKGSFRGWAHQTTTTTIVYGASSYLRILREAPHVLDERGPDGMVILGYGDVEEERILDARGTTVTVRPVAVARQGRGYGLVEEDWIVAYDATRVVLARTLTSALKAFRAL